MRSHLPTIFLSVIATLCAGALIPVASAAATLQGQGGSLISDSDLPFFRYIFVITAPKGSKRPPEIAGFAKLLGLDQRESAILSQVCKDVHSYLAQLKTRTDQKPDQASLKEMMVARDRFIRDQANRLMGELGGVGASKVRMVLNKRPINGSGVR